MMMIIMGWMDGFLLADPTYHPNDGKVVNGGGPPLVCIVVVVVVVVVDDL